MVSKSKSSSKSPSLTKGNKAKINTLALSRKLGPDALALIAKHLKKAEKAKYNSIRKYSQGYDYFYEHYSQIMRSLHNYIWNKVTSGSGGFILASDLPNGIDYHNKGFREAVIWKKIGKIFPTRRFKVSNDVKDAAIFLTINTLKDPIQYSQCLLIQRMIANGGHRNQLNNDYDKLAGFVDALLDEIEAEIKARK